MKRFKHSLSHYKLVTQDMGQLVPVGCVEALPGDTFQHATSALIRMSPLNAPVMHPVTVRLHHWFVPHRLVYDGWEDFITGGSDGLGSAEPYPTNAAPVTPLIGELWDYLGVPLDRTQPVGALSLLPIRAYNLIYNEFYRDEDLAQVATEDDDKIKLCAWEKDYFTSARPWTQKGPEVTLPIGNTAPVITNDQLILMKTAADPNSTNLTYSGLPNDEVSLPQAQFGGSQMMFGSQSGLIADLANATATDVNDFRRAFALQRYQEARAQYGSRYTEYLRYCGIRPADARLQRPEYLGGGKQTIAFSEVLRTGNDPATSTSTTPVGEMLGHGIAAMRSNRYRYFCQEHGHIMTLMSIRPRTMYQDGLNKMWSRRLKEDYYQKELELIGQQEVYNREIYAKGDASDDAVFGYQDRYSDYRHQWSGVTGEFRNLLDYWHLGRKFNDTPVLNQFFTDCSPDKRIFAEQTQNSAWVMVSHSIQARRMVGKRTIGKIE